MYPIRSPTHCFRLLVPLLPLRNRLMTVAMFPPIHFAYKSPAVCSDECISFPWLCLTIDTITRHLSHLLPFFRFLLILNGSCLVIFFFLFFWRSIFFSVVTWKSVCHVCHRCSSPKVASQNYICIVAEHFHQTRDEILPEDFFFHFQISLRSKWLPKKIVLFRFVSLLKKIIQVTFDLVAFLSPKPSFLPPPLPELPESDYRQ